MFISNVVIKFSFFFVLVRTALQNELHNNDPSFLGKNCRDWICLFPELSSELLLKQLGVCVCVWVVHKILNIFKTSFMDSELIIFNLSLSQI